MSRLVIKDRRVLVTGGASGIGRALVREFLREGCRVAALDKDAGALEGLSREAALLGFGLETAVADVGAKEGFLAALEACCAEGPPFILVNNAGIATVGGFLETGLEGLESVLRVNLGGVLYGTYFGLSRMQAAGEGVIVNMASIAGHIPAAHLAGYCASKHGVVGLTRALRAELALAGSPVRLCLVSPGFVDTPLMKQGLYALPAYLNALVEKPAAVAREIVQSIRRGDDEIYPTPGGRLMNGMHRLAPSMTSKFSSRLLLAGSLRELLGLSPIKPL